MVFLRTSHTRWAVGRCAATRVQYLRRLRFRYFSCGQGRGARGVQLGLSTCALDRPAMWRGVGRGGGAAARSVSRV